MSLTNPKTIFGVHSLTVYDRNTRIPEAFLRVLGTCEIALTPEMVSLRGGSNRFPWDSEVASIGSEFSLTAREYPMKFMELALSGDTTEYDDETSGEIIFLENVKGTSCYHASSGIASIDFISLKTADLKEGEYVIEVTDAAADKVDVYCLSNANFSRGETGEYLDDDLKIAEDLVVTSASTTDITDYGIKITGGSGTIDMTLGDTLRFAVRRNGKTGFSMVVGRSGSSFEKKGLLLTGQVAGDDSLTYIDIYKAQIAGMPVSFAEGAYSEWSITITLEYSSTKDGVYTIVRNG
jgi:hypothetical protein